VVRHLLLALGQVYFIGVPLAVVMIVRGKDRPLPRWLKYVAYTSSIVGAVSMFSTLFAGLVYFG